jgi:hypothetical protein
MTQQRRVKPAVGVAAVGLGLGAGVIGLYRGAQADPPRPAAANSGSLLAEGRALLRQNKLGAALARADEASKQGGSFGTDSPDALRRDALADARTQMDELTAQAKVLADRGDTLRAKASLDLAKAIAAEIGQATSPAAEPGTIQQVVFHPADPVLPPALPTLPPPAKVELPTPPVEVTPPALPPPIGPTPPPAAVPVSREPENPLLPAPPALTLNPGGPAVPPAVPEAARPEPSAPGDAPVTLPKLATAAVGAALAAAPLPAQDAPAKPGPAAGGGEMVRPLPPPPPPATKEQLDAVKADVEALKDYKRQVQDLLQGKADGPGKSPLDAGVLKRLTDLDDRLTKIEKTLSDLQGAITRLGENRASSSLSPGAPPVTPAPATAPAPTPATKSVVRVVNDYPTELRIYVNNQGHVLKPGETRAIDVPAGKFTYELLAEGSKPISRDIRDDETVTLRIK